MLPFLHHDDEAELRQKCCEWFRASRHALLSYARQQADSEEDVELLLVKVTERVCHAICCGKVPVGDIAPYTLRALYYGAIDMRKRSALRHAAEMRYFNEAEILQGVHTDESPCELEDKHILARQALRALPEELYTVVTLRLWCEMSFAEIAKKLRSNERTVRRRYDKGLRQIKEKLSE